MKPFALSQALENVRATVPLVHCITNYVTVNDCANALLACGGSPIMSDEASEVCDIQTICGGLVVNIGTLNEHTIEGMYAASARARDLKHPIVLDPVGAGASWLRTTTAVGLLNSTGAQVIRGNMSEIKALVGSAAATRGVDVNPDDVVTKDNLAECAAFAKTVAAKTKSIVVITGAIDLVADGNTAYAIYNGNPIMGRITGTGCMLTCVVAAYVIANPDMPLEAVVAAVAGHGLAGEIAFSRMTRGFSRADGSGTFRTYLIDALYNMDGATLERGARVVEV